MFATFEIVRFFIGFNIVLEAEMRVTREADRFHYGWFCNLAVDFNKSKESSAPKSFFAPEFTNSVLSFNEINEIRNNINYMLEAEDDADEEFFNDFTDPFQVEYGDPFEVGEDDPFEIEDGDPFATGGE